MTNREAFAKNLNHLISIKCIRQVDIARALGVTRSTVCRWCEGSSIPSGKKLVALSEYLSITPSVIMGEKSTLTQIDEERVLHGFRMLSPVGKEKLLERMEELKQLYWYDKENVAK